MTILKQSVLALALLGSATSLQAVESWVDGNASAIYWFGEDEKTFERGSDVRDNPTALSGTATSIDEELNRVTGQWVPQNYDEYYLDTSSGNWVVRGNEYTFNITGENHEVMEIFDGYVRLDDIIDIAGQIMPFRTCFGLPAQTFADGAKRYVLAWKSKETYKLDWVPEDGTLNPPQPFSTLADFVSSDYNTFLFNRNTGEQAGFRHNANLSDGSGDLVILTFDETSYSFNEGDIIGSWVVSTLPGQDENSSIKFTFTEQGFTGHEEDYLFATVYNSVVWLGEHSPAGTEFTPIPLEEEWFFNEASYNQMLSVVEAHKAEFAKLITCDLVDRRFQYHMDNAFSSSYVSFFGNMNYIMTDENDNPIEAGEWSVQNGVVVRDAVENDINKTLNVEKVNFFSLINGHSDLIHIESGRGAIVEEKGQVWGNRQLPETDIPHTVTYANIKGKKINLTYQDSEETGTADIYLYPNMTYSFGASGDDVGVWKIENGVLVVDSYWLDDYGTPRTDTESWVFSDATHADIMIGGEKDANVTINSVTDLTGSETLPNNFTEAAVDHPFTLNDLLGKIVTIGDPSAPQSEVKLYFYDDFTFKEEGEDDQGNTETVTGTWQVVEGAIIVDVVYSDDESSHYIITDNGNGTIDIMDLVAGGTERDSNVNVLDIADIPSGISPAIIMYLLN